MQVELILLLLGVQSTPEAQWTYPWGPRRHWQVTFSMEAFLAHNCASMKLVEPSIMVSWWMVSELSAPWILDWAPIFSEKMLFEHCPQPTRQPYFFQKHPLKLWRILATFLLSDLCFPIPASSDHVCWNPEETQVPPGQQSNVFHVNQPPVIIVWR